MKLKGHLQLSGDISARNFPQDDDFYGITIKQTSGVESFRGINTLAFSDENFYITQNVPNTDEAVVSFRGVSTSAPGISTINFREGEHLFSDDEVNFNSEYFYLTGNSTGEPVVNLISKSSALFLLGATQSTDIGVNDHIKFDTIAFSVGNNIRLDTTSVYTNGTGASIGRITLQPHRVYSITSNQRPVFSGATGAASFIIANDSSTQFGGGARQISISVTTEHNDNQGTCEAIVAPAVATLYEVRIQAATVLTSISGGGSFVTYLKVIEL